MTRPTRITRPKRRREWNQFTVFGMFVVFLVCFGASSYMKAHWNEHTAVCTVTDKDRDRTSRSDGKSSARIYTEQCGVLANEDSFWRGKHRSADIQGQLQIGRTYELVVAGWRFGPTSSFPNVIKVKGEVGR